MTAPARRAFLDQFYAGIDPALPEAERDRIASARRRAHMTRLAQSAATSRRRAAEAAAAAVQAEAAHLAARANPV